MVLALALMTGGCATHSKAGGGGSIAEQAHDAQLKGDWENAFQLWKQAIQAEQGLWSDPELATRPKLLAVYYYEAGRSAGVVGRYDEADFDLKVALRLDEKFNGPRGMDMVELARLNHARGDNTWAIYYLRQILPRADETIGHVPEQYVALMIEAAAVAKATGDMNLASRLEAKAKAVSDRHPGLKPPSDWTPYKMQ
ncbi:MAG TPA: hypothetical protein VG347_18020 [Verrucomicrobiae bacterium]|nr:hypothetical protein [Verrucomicrobiae bacterium]